MLMTVTNTSGRTINAADQISAGSGPSGILATGGNVTDPLPYPFSLSGSLADTVGRQLPMRNRDWRYQRSAYMPECSIQWQQLVQAGVVTMAVASETGNLDEEELYVNAV